MDLNAEPFIIIVNKTYIYIYQTNRTSIKNIKFVIVIADNSVNINEIYKLYT